ncbi:anhydro-N-acetylmuramic acid kinase [Legionella maioricensis]|uniref:Anhydro-N-acetylmuramic acid kinase n=1 Tax=Legionella maioricensis TaxID=2896528 RepID=A0A9X2D1U2_9GAMM|nr:anhydro-N-acetylmuramic acid kinase [Legionella maioricensis]MCL9684222.1 anhydro-N-acetylmuramic acid kinase [Legionella maioricensis]MCL9687088.1 anhydro-N-acetylmuramic acid kinase [Legionella maioricensis]
MALYIGLMSGTSMDGIDAALVEMPTNTLKYGITVKYSDEVKKNIDHVISSNNLSLASVCQLNTLIGREFAGAVNNLLQEANISPNDIMAIGSHGQTLCHDTSVSIPYTLQLGCGHTISSLTGITVVADFRTRDLVNGGQGAPFAPLYHQELFNKPDINLAVLNIGGISNVSFIASGQRTEGWDIGPGNCLMDAWITEHQGKSFDADGLWAMQGEIIRPLLDQLLSDPFFGLVPPKSIGKEYFSLLWLKSYLKKEYKAVDVQATLLALTAHSIATTILRKETIKQLYLCGGGTHNLYLRKMLADLLPGIAVNSIADIGVSPDYLEAMMFAWLASQTMNQIPVNLTAITGAKRPAILGAIYPIKSY